MHMRAYWHTMSGGDHRSRALCTVPQQDQETTGIAPVLVQVLWRPTVRISSGPLESAMLVEGMQRGMQLALAVKRYSC